MSEPLDPSDRHLHRAAVWLCGTAVLGGLVMTVLHRLEPDPSWLDLTVPPTIAAFVAALLVVLLRRPERTFTVMRLGFALVVTGMVLPAWIYPWLAWTTPGRTLVDTCPPFFGMLLPLTMGAVVFLRPRDALRITVLAWILIATPMLAYLLARPAELLTPRGMDIALILGPAMMVNLVLLPFHDAIKEKLGLAQRTSAELRELTERDPLTGAGNRRAAERHLDALLSEAPVAAVLFDVDRFKTINDQHGHPVGDAVLREVVRRCQQAVRRGDLLARWGGEEFLVVLTGITVEQSVEIADHLRLAVAAEPIPPVGTVTASFGVAWADQPESPTSLLDRADGALYRAKQTGRNRVVVAPGPRA
jgi:diguanylate cyclase (GGDEF)-like protein